MKIFFSEFSIDSKTGVIKTRKMLDFDLEYQYFLTVLAEDNGIPKHQDQTIVTVYLEDKNDNSPRFRLSEYTGKFTST